MKIKKNNMKLKLSVSLLLLSFVFSQCKFGSNSTGDKQSIVNDFKRGKDLDPREWNCQNVENNTICIPTNWKFIQQNKAFYFATLNNEDKNTFFAIVKFNTNLKRLDAEQYLQDGYSQMLKDTIETLTGYTLKKITFKNKVSYYTEWFAKLNEKEYFAYSMVFEKNGYMYDIGLKLTKAESPKYKEIFTNILFNFKIDNKPLFDEFDEIEKIDLIDLAKNKPFGSSL